ncbi:MAG: right-handed parallel beta-helix repeat-containing protein, partial [Cytophagales bacterium]
MKRIVVAIAMTSSLFLAAQTTITVTNANNDGAGSLRAAIAQWIGNGPKTIVFDPAVFNNDVTEISLTSALNIGYFGVDNGTALIINGQTGLSAGRRVKITFPTASVLGDNTFIFNSNNIQLVGLEIHSNPASNALLLRGNTHLIDNCIIRGNAGNGVFLESANSVTIRNSEIYSNARNLNNQSYLSGIRVEGSTTGVIIENNIIGTNAVKATGLGNGYEGITLFQASNVIVRNNTIVGNGNLNSFIPGGGGLGVRLNANNNTVTNNSFGSFSDFSGINGNWNYGVSVEGSSNNTVGGNASNLGNLVVASRNGGGIILQNDFNGNGSSNNSILYNRIGNVNNNATLNINGPGILITGSSNSNTIGSETNPNTISSSNNINGVEVSGNNANRNRIVGNSIFCLGNGKAIALLNNGNANFSSGNANNFYQELTPGLGLIRGRAVANSRIDIYRTTSTTCPNNCSASPATNFASAQTWVATVNANASGDWTYSAGITAGTESQYSATATSTSAPLNNTSELLPCKELCVNAVAPTSITNSTPNICSGANATLTAVGGSGNQFVWYTGSCGGTQVGTGTTLNITNLTTTTTYFGRWESSGSCTNSTCLQATINVFNPPLTTNAVTALSSPLCVGTDGTVRIANSQTGVTYQLQIGSNNVGTATPGNGGNLDITVPSASLVAGTNTITVRATNTNGTCPAQT